jgi:hypothetical protein
MVEVQVCEVSLAQQCVWIFCVPLLVGCSLADVTMVTKAFTLLWGKKDIQQ